jgi:hypothetical protein
MLFQTVADCLCRQILKPLQKNRAVEVSRTPLGVDRFREIFDNIQV